MATVGHKLRSWVWQYFKKLDKFFAKCNLCVKTLRYYSKLNTLRSHLFLVHDVSNEQNKLTWRDESNLLWRYFTKNENHTKVTCKFCNKVIVIYCNRQYYLQSHLQYCHSYVICMICEEIRRTWVSPHFTFDMPKCYIKCIHCEWIFKIFVGINQLESHLFQCHKINENSGNHEGINDNNRNIMTQQSVPEENYASTSSHHDNRHEQNAGNQTVQQRDNTNMDSSTSSEDDNHDTTSAMWQPWK